MTAQQGPDDQQVEECCPSCGYGTGTPGQRCAYCEAADKAAQWDAAQPMIGAMTEVVAAAWGYVNCPPTPSDAVTLAFNRLTATLHKLDALAVG